MGRPPSRMADINEADIFGEEEFDHDLPMRQGDDDCPICYGERALVGRVAVCPNGHRLCAECQPHVQSVRNHRTGQANCPLCRANIPYVPRQAQAPQGGDPLGEQGQPPRQPRPPRDNRDELNAYQLRRQRAIEGFQNNHQNRRAGREQFLQLRDQGQIPGNALYGGVHDRKCGVRGCHRVGGIQGVRFLKDHFNHRKYRCEACYMRENNGMAPEPAPAFTQFQHH